MTATIVPVIVLTVYGLGFGGSSDVPPIEVGPDFKEVFIGRQAEIFRDPGGGLSFEDVSSPSFSKNFEPHQGDTYSRGFDPSAYWFRFRMKKTGEGDRHGRLILTVARPILMELDLYVPVRDGPKGGMRHLRAGFVNYGVYDDLGHQYPALELPLAMEYGPYVYLRVRTNIVCYSIRLFSQASFNDHVRFEYTLFGLTFGIMGAMLLYNLVLAIFLREKVYLAYCLYIACMNAYVSIQSGWLLGLGLHPDVQMATVLPFFAAAFFFAMAFSRIFLMTPGRHRNIDRVFLLLMGLAMVDFTLAVTGFYVIANRIAYLVGMGSPVVIIICAAIRWRQGYRPARYYLAAWIVLFSCSSFYAASGMGLIGYILPIYNIVGLGAAAESILLALALADRIRILREERSRLRERERRLRELSITDELTGLYNKRWFSSKMQSEIEHARRLDRPLSLVLLDVDRFKNFNDKYGHAAGDRALAELGRTISDAIRLNDIPCRYGGEEFAVILPGANREEAFGIAERLRLDFGSKKITVPQHGNIGLTISLGVGELNGGDEVDAFFERTDRALYRAKEEGRNRVVVV